MGIENEDGLTDAPDRAGWWDWLEGGDGEPERLLLTGGGRLVADDDEWERATGRSPDHNCWTENYWEGTDTDQKTMPGLWRYVGPAKVQ